MPVKSHGQGRCSGRKRDGRRHHPLSMPRLRGIFTPLTKLCSAPLTVMYGRLTYRQRSKTNKSNREFWKKLTFDWLVVNPAGLLGEFPSSCKDCCYWTELDILYLFSYLTVTRSFQCFPSFGQTTVTSGMHLSYLQYAALFTE
jgi:hypothetical protein